MMKSQAQVVHFVLFSTCDIVSHCLLNISFIPIDNYCFQLCWGPSSEPTVNAVTHGSSTYWKQVMVECSALSKAFISLPIWLRECLWRGTRKKMQELEEKEESLELPPPSSRSKNWNHEFIVAVVTVNLSENRKICRKGNCRKKRGARGERNKNAFYIMCKNVTEQI